MESDRHKTFRLRGLPQECQTRRNVREFVMRVLSIETGASLTVHSFATCPIEKNSKVATLSFHTLPHLLSDGSRNEWIVVIPPGEDEDEDDAHSWIKPLVFDTHFTGFTPLQRTEDDDCFVDLIAVAGLGGHAFGSFKERSGPFMWLRDALPLDAPGVRVLIYGYKSQLSQSSSFQSLTDLGKALQVDIRGIREVHQPRPMILIGHSLGGLVIKEAIVKMKDGNETEDMAIFNSISSFLFFGVPHQGMAIESLVPLVRDNPNRALLETLNKNSALLSRLEKDFSGVFGDKRPQVVSFYETQRSPTAVEKEPNKWDLSGSLEVLVEVPSATCGSKHQHPIDRNHREMVKYNSQYDEVYRRVWIVLRPLVSRARAIPVEGSKQSLENAVPKTLSEENIECLRSLSFPEQERRYNDIHSAQDTCDWLLEDPGYRNWVNGQRGLFWIKGNPGAGKSVLIKFAYGAMKQRGSGELVVPFFIHGRGSSLQKTPLGLYRALLNSMLRSFPECLDRLTKTFEDRETRFGSYHEKRWFWEEAELQKVLSDVLSNETELRPVVIFIDALDECGKGPARKLLTYFRQLMATIEKRFGRVKICFASRHFPILGLLDVPLIFVEERNDKDIRHVIKETLTDVRPKEKRQQIEKDILLKAQGGFQWAVLVANIATEESLNGVKAETIHEKIKTTPEALDELYTDILSGVTESERQQVEKLFQWVLFAERPLSTQELRDSLATDEAMICTTVAKLRTNEIWIDNLTDFERRIIHLSKGLIEFQTREIWEQYEIGGEDFDREAQFIHQSVPDYLLKNFFRCAGDLENSLSSNIAAGHFEISWSCLRYLTLKEVLQGAQLPRAKLSARFPLAPYAVQFFFYHIQKAELDAQPQLDLPSLIGWGDQLESLEKLWRVLDPGGYHKPWGWPFIGATTLHVLVALGSKSAFDMFLQTKDVEVDGRDAEGNTPLLLAIREGHQDMALALIRRSMEWQLRSNQLDGKAPVSQDTELRKSHFVDINVENKDGDTPITIAFAEKSGSDLISALIEAGAELKFFGQETETIFRAISSRNKTLLRHLIGKKIQLNRAVFFAVKESSRVDDPLEEMIVDLLKAGATASQLRKSDHHIHDADDSVFDQERVDDHESLHVASRRGLTAVVQLLLLYGVSTDSRDSFFRCPLLIAVSSGHEETAKVLFQSAPSSVELPDYVEETALSTAVNLNYLELAETSIAEGDFPASSFSLYYALLKAISRGYLTVIMAAILRDRSMVNTPISEDTFRYLQVFKNPQEALWFEIGETALSTSVREGMEDVALILIREGHDSNTGVDESGLNPLALSISKGLPDVTKALIQSEPSAIDSVVQYWTTVLPDAIRGDKEEVIMVLINEGYVAHNWTDDRGLPPLIIAIMEGSTRIANALIWSDELPICFVDRHGATALTYAILKGNPEVEDAIRRNLRCWSRDERDSDEQRDFIRAWVSSSTISDANNRLFYRKGKTALIHAVVSGNVLLTKLLIEKGTERTLNLVDEDGRTALWYALQRQDAAIIQALVLGGAKYLGWAKHLPEGLSLAACVMFSDHRQVRSLLTTTNAIPAFRQRIMSTSREQPLRMHAMIT